MNFLFYRGAPVLWPWVFPFYRGPTPGGDGCPRFSTIKWGHPPPRLNLVGDRTHIRTHVRSHVCTYVRTMFRPMFKPMFRPMFRNKVTFEKWPPNTKYALGGLGSYRNKVTFYIKGNLKGNLISEHACERACVHAHERACVHAYVRAYMRMCDPFARPLHAPSTLTSTFDPSFAHTPRSPVRSPPARGWWFACGGKMCQSLVAVKTFNFYCRKWFFFTAAGDCCFCVAGGGKIAFPFSIACGGKKSIACGGKWVSLMPGYTKPIACGSKRLGLGICTWQLLLEKAYLSSLGSRISSGKCCCNCEPWEQTY